MSEEKPDNSIYLGDGVYAYADGMRIELTTCDGLMVTNRIYLDHDTLKTLLQWLKRLELISERVAAEDPPPFF